MTEAVEGVRAPMPDPEEYIKKAKYLAKEAFNREFTPGEDTRPAIDEDFYVVWFAKTLGNWKALVSTDLISSQYWELTHNGAKKETYVDHYIKQQNWAIPDAPLS